MTTTTHISIFSLSGERVLLKTKYPAMIFPLFIFMPIFSIAVLAFIMRADSRLKTAHMMLNQ